MNSLTSAGWVFKALAPGYLRYTKRFTVFGCSLALVAAREGDFDGRAHRGRDGGLDDEGALDGRGAAADDVFADGREVVEEIGIGEGGLGDRHREVAIAVDAVGDFALLDLGDGGFDA